MPEFLLSVVGSAVIAGVVEIVAMVFGHSASYFVLWLLVFLAWWGFVFFDGDLFN